MASCDSIVVIKPELCPTENIVFPFGAMGTLTIAPQLPPTTTTPLLPNYDFEPILLFKKSDGSPVILQMTKLATDLPSAPPTSSYWDVLANAPYTGATSTLREGGQEQYDFTSVTEYCAGGQEYTSYDIMNVSVSPPVVYSTIWKDSTGAVVSAPASAVLGKCAVAVSTIDFEPILMVKKSDGSPVLMQSSKLANALPNDPPVITYWDVNANAPYTLASTTLEAPAIDKFIIGSEQVYCDNGVEYIATDVYTLTTNPPSLHSRIWKDNLGNAVSAPVAPILGKCNASSVNGNSYSLEKDTSGIIAAGKFSAVVVNVGDGIGILQGAPFAPTESRQFTGYFNPEINTLVRLSDITYDATNTIFHITIQD